MERSFKEIMNDITTFVFDVDGVLTNGFLHISSEGKLLRQMNVRDGFAMKLAIEQGYNICIITGGREESVRTRLEELGVKDIYIGIRNKIEVFEEYINNNGIKKSQVLYMGDDIPDLAVMKEVILPACPQDAVNEVKALSRYISHKNGGEGAVRDVIEQVMKVQNKWIAE